MHREILGIHHVTAIAGDPQANVDFYAGVLGLRLVKLTVNFDDPGAYHLYYGDEAGHPGTIVTFFAWPGAPQGRRGAGQVVVTSFSVPESALGYWIERFGRHGVGFARPVERFDGEILRFVDPDGLELELIAAPGADDGRPWAAGPVPPEHAIRGVYGVTLAERSIERTAALLGEVMGFRLMEQSSELWRFEAGSGAARARVDVLAQPEEPRGHVAVGTVHHVAWRTPDEAEQHFWRGKVAASGIGVSAVMDRTYFRSIYFREPGGVLFEIATDPPGFTVDEPAEHLGTRLALPPWLEPQRARLEQALPPLRLPAVVERS